MNLLDYVIIIMLLLSALMGFRKGFISSIVSFVGTLIVIVLAFYLKSPVSSFLYEHMPFFSFAGKFTGMSILNILIYEAISYIITLVLLSIILSIIVKFSGIFNKLVHATVVLSLPSKLLGGLCGLIEGAVISFVLIFVLSLISPFSALYNNSKYADTILSKTPVLSELVKDSYNSVYEVYQIAIKNETKKDKTEANLDALRILLKYEIISAQSAEKLVNDGKLELNGASKVIDNYKKGMIS